jgi:hypothetical protein
MTLPPLSPGHQSQIQNLKSKIQNPTIALEQLLHYNPDTWAELKQMALDAVRCHFEEDEQPTLVRLHLVREEVVLV